MLLGVILNDKLVGRIERTGALDAASLVGPLRDLNAGLRSAAAELAGGHVVLLGAGMYVNRAMALGLDVEVTDTDFDTLEALCLGVSVPPEIEVCPWAHHSLLEKAADRGYSVSWFRTTLAYQLDSGSPATSHPDISIEKVASESSLATWQDATASGFGYTTTEQRRISDLYTAAVDRTDATSLFLARANDRVVGAAALTIRGGIATLGGMSTLPSARGQGVQTALVGFRLERAAAAGCDVAITTAAPGGVSERNLIRSGFSVIYTKIGVSRRAAA